MIPMDPTVICRKVFPIRKDWKFWKYVTFCNILLFLYKNVVFSICFSLEKSLWKYLPGSLKTSGRRCVKRLVDQNPDSTKLCEKVDRIGVKNLWLIILLTITVLIQFLFAAKSAYFVWHLCMFIHERVHFEDSYFWAIFVAGTFLQLSIYRNDSSGSLLSPLSTLNTQCDDASIRYVLNFCSSVCKISECVVPVLLTFWKFLKLLLRSLTKFAIVSFLGS